MLVSLFWIENDFTAYYPCWGRAAIPAVAEKRKGVRSWDLMDSNIEAARATPDPVSNVKDLSTSPLQTASLVPSRPKEGLDGMW